MCTYIKVGRGTFPLLWFDREWVLRVSVSVPVLGKWSIKSEKPTRGVGPVFQSMRERVGIGSLSLVYICVTVHVDTDGVTNLALSKEKEKRGWTFGVQGPLQVCFWKVRKCVS